MPHSTTFSEKTLPAKPQAPVYLIQHQQSHKSPQGLDRYLQWWYKLTSPPEPGAVASLEERELFRRGRIGSQINLVLFIMAIPAYQAGFAGGNHSLMANVLVVNIWQVLALILNRLGKVTAAGIIIVLSFTLSPFFNILTTPGGVNTSALTNFCMLVIPLICTVSFLPAGWVFVVATVNCLFTLVDLLFLPGSGELHTQLKVAAPGIIVPILLSQVIVSTAAFLWVRSAEKAIQRADQAEEIARLEHDMALQAEVIAEQKQQLDVSIQRIVETHTRVANGDFNARVPLTQDNVLWQISGSLNNLLARLQRLRQANTEIQQMQLALKQARAENARLKKQLEQKMRYCKGCEFLRQV